MTDVTKWIVSNYKIHKRGQSETNFTKYTQHIDAHTYTTHIGDNNELKLPIFLYNMNVNTFAIFSNHDNESTCDSTITNLLCGWCFFFAVFWGKKDR